MTISGFNVVDTDSVGYIWGKTPIKDAPNWIWTDPNPINPYPNSQKYSQKSLDEFHDMMEKAAQKQSLQEQIDRLEKKLDKILSLLKLLDDE